MKTIRYPMTIPAELNEACRKIVEGDRHFRGSRNQFFIEAIEEAVKARLGYAAALEGRGKGVVVQAEPGEARQEEPGEAKSTGLNAEPKAAAPAAVPQPTAPAGRKPMLSFYGGEIRNASGTIYRVKSGPKMAEGEMGEAYFERIKTVPGVMFEPVQPDFSPNPLNHPLITGGAEF